MLFGESIERDWFNVAMRLDAKIVGQLGEIQSRCNLHNLNRLFFIPFIPLISNCKLQKQKKQVLRAFIHS